MKKTPAPLSTLHCSQCGAALPLSVLQPNVPCAHCGAPNELPTSYLAASALRAREVEARRAAEPLWRTLADQPPRRARLIGVLAVLLLPPAVTLAAQFLPAVRPDGARTIALFALPALLPGAVLWLWSAAVIAAAAGLRSLLSARPAARGEGSFDCRHCGAPLALEEGALSATCGYCGADSLLRGVEPGVVRRELQQALRTLADALATLRRRRLTLALGLAGVATLVGGASVLLWLAILAVG